MLVQPLDIRPLHPSDAPELARVFKALVEAGDNRMFHPHPFDEAAARAVCAPRRDLYAGAFVNGDVAAYGMLRGWEEGYDVPSLGVAVSPAYRHLGVGKAMVAYLGSAAALRGAPRVRLTVHRSNDHAIGIYRRLGYRFEAPDSNGVLTGYLDLRQ